jgi:hypothetical protein
MDPRTAKRLVLPAVLIVTTYVSATSCKYDPSREEHCADIEGQADCDSVEGCAWDTEFGSCSETCHLNETQAECEAIDRCVWYPDGGPGSAGTETGGTETGGAASCEPPFS